MSRVQSTAFFFPHWIWVKLNNSWKLPQKLPFIHLRLWSRSPTMSSGTSMDTVAVFTKIVFHANREVSRAQESIFSSTRNLIPKNKDISWPTFGYTGSQLCESVKRLLKHVWQLMLKLLKAYQRTQPLPCIPSENFTIRYCAAHPVIRHYILPKLVNSSGR
jgi:hypothetical protein